MSDFIKSRQSGYLLVQETRYAVNLNTYDS